MRVRIVEVVRAAAMLGALGLLLWARGQAKTAPPAPAGVTWPWMSGGVLNPPARWWPEPFSRRRVADPTVPLGQVLVMSPGVQGAAYGPARTPLWQEPPSPEVLAVGTANVQLLQVRRRRYAYVRVLSMTATAYNGSRSMNGPWGAVSAWTGKPLAPGDVAVDPAVIPLGTRLYVSGYGPALADDTGAAIVGDRIDLYFNEPSGQVSRFGIRVVKVYVLANGAVPNPVAGPPDPAGLAGGG